MRWMLLGLWLACAAWAWANDGRMVGEGGRVRLARGERTTVRMVDEAIRMDVYPAYYDVTVDFRFRNDGKAVTVQMGFPESGGGDGVGEHYVNHSGFLSFRTWVDGRPVTAVRTGDADRTGGGYRAFWVKTVAFARGQERRVRVQYRTRQGNDTSRSHNLGYAFTGGNWAGRVAESTLTVAFHTPDTVVVHVGELPNAAAVAASGWKGNQFTARWTNWQADGAFFLGYRATYPDWLTFSSEESYLAPAADDAVITRPGAVPELDWLPPVVRRRGTLFVNLRALCGYLSARADRAGTHGQVSLTWDAAMKTARLQAGRRTLRLTWHQPEMLVDGARTVTLDALPFLSRPLRYEGSALYAPLAPVLAALGGTAREEKNRRVKLEVPAFWE